MARRPMGKRRATAEACAVLMLLIQNYLDVGQPSESCHDGDGGWTTEDEEPLTDAFERLMDEMNRRSSRLRDRRKY